MSDTTSTELLLKMKNGDSSQRRIDNINDALIWLLNELVCTF